MVARRTLIGSTSGLPAQILVAQNAPGGPKAVLTHDLPDLTLKGWPVTVGEVSYGPGESTPARRHPGITIAYVLEREPGKNG
jgi:hypothetical protein